MRAQCAVAFMTASRGISANRAKAGLGLARLVVPPSQAVRPSGVVVRITRLPLRGSSGIAWQLPARAPLSVSPPQRTLLGGTFALFARPARGRLVGAKGGFSAPPHGESAAPFYVTYFTFKMHFLILDLILFFFSIVAAMVNELNALESKIAQVAGLCRALRNENRDLQQRLRRLEAEKRQLTERMDTARSRLEALVGQLPEAKA